MTILWRISNYVDLRGEGGLRHSSRWHTAGPRIVFLAESPASALVETLVHLQVKEEDIPDAYTLLKISIPENLGIVELDVSKTENWKSDVVYTRGLGDAWLRSRDSALARVPSAIIAETWNCLLNPDHPDAAEVTISSVIRDRLDKRLFGFGER